MTKKQMDGWVDDIDIEHILFFLFLVELIPAVY